MITNRKADRDLLIALTESLSVSRGRLRRDACGDWVITGTRGHILTDGISAFAYVPAGTARRWERAKRILNFMTVTQDADDEGILRLDGMPTPEQAKIIRTVLGFRQRTELSEADRAELKNRFKSPSQRGVSDGLIDVAEDAPTNPPGDTENPIHDAETADSSVGPGALPERIEERAPNAGATAVPA